MGEGAADKKLRDVLAYLCAHYPHPSELSNARVTKMIYLADWRSAITQGRPMTAIRWTFNHYGPYVSDVVELAQRDEAFQVLYGENLFGSTKRLIRLVEPGQPTRLSDEERAILDFVIAKTKGMYWNEFLSLVYSTYPVRTQPRYSELNLAQLAKEYEAREPGGGLVSG